MSMFIKNSMLSLVPIAMFLLLFSFGLYVHGSSTSEFNVTINSGTLSVDITDASYASVASPSVTFSSQTFSFNCGTTTASFGTTTERIYVQNPDSADDGWTVSLAAAATTSTWQSASSSAEFDFNDYDGACTDGADPDSVAGRMTVDPSAGSISTGNCASCVTTGVSLGSSATFNQGSTDSITIFSANASSSDIGDWYVTDVDMTQTLPPEQAAHSDYSINLTLSIIAS